MPLLQRSVSSISTRRLPIDVTSMNRTLLSISLMLALGLSACSVVPNAPPKEPPVSQPEIELSSLDLKVVVPYSVLTQKLNRAIQNEIYNVPCQNFDCPVTACSFRVRVLRNGDIRARHDNNGRLIVTMPVRTEGGRINAKQRVLGQTIFDLEANFADQCHRHCYSWFRTES